MTKEKNGTLPQKEKTLIVAGQGSDEGQEETHVTAGFSPNSIAENPVVVKDNEVKKMKKDTKFDAMNGFVCPECEKQFFPPIQAVWAYRVGRRLVCSYHCMINGRVRRASRGKPPRPVELVDEQGNVIRTFDDAAVASVLLGIDAKSIRDCCVGRHKTCNGKIFRYKEEATV
jgi:hypothetical protein